MWGPPIDSPPSSDNRPLWTDSRRATFLAAALIIVAGLAAYANSFHGPLIIDDVSAIRDNPTIRRLWRIGEVLSPPCDGGTLTSRPLLNLSLAINYHVGGLNVWGYHATNLAIHLVGGLLLLGILRRTFQLSPLQPRFGDAAWGLALTIGLLWTLHPLQTESVTYIIQRAESLAGLFYFLVLYSVIRGSQSRLAGWWYTIAVGACLLGVAAKETVITAPLVVLLYDRTFLADSFQAALRRRWALYLGLFAGWGLQVYLQARTGLPVLEYQLGPMGLLHYACSQPGVILHYLRLSLWPCSLCLDYEWPVATTAGTILPGVLIVGAILVATAMGLLRRSAVGYLGACFFLILAPTSSILPLKQLACEHRMYLPLAAVVTLLVAGGYLVIQGLVRRGWITHRAALIGSVCAVVMTGVALGLVTNRRNEAYRSESSIWRETMIQAPGNARAWYNYGTTLSDLGRFAEAVGCYQQAVRINPRYATAYNNWGNALFRLNRFAEAIEQYQHAIRTRPDYAEAQDNIGAAMIAMGRWEEAVEQSSRAVQINPGSADARGNLGVALMHLGRLPEAIEQLQQAVQIKPESAVAYNNLGLAMARSSRLEEAVGQYEHALQIDPDYAEAHCNLGLVLADLRRVLEAIRHCREAVRRKPDLAMAHLTLCSMLAQTADYPEAIEHGRQAVRLMPGQPQVMRLVAWLMATHEPVEAGEPQQAMELAEGACALTNRRDPMCLDTLAAAYASAGRFDKAVPTALEAWQMAQSASQLSMAEEIHMRLQLFRQNKPYREPAISATRSDR